MPANTLVCLISEKRGIKFDGGNSSLFSGCNSCSPLLRRLFGRNSIHLNWTPELCSYILSYCHRRTLLLDNSVNPQFTFNDNIF